MTNDTFRKAKMIKDSLCEISNLRVIISDDFVFMRENKTTGREEFFRPSTLGEETAREIRIAIHKVLSEREKELKAEFEEL